MILMMVSVYHRKINLFFRFVDNQIDWHSFRKEMEKSGLEEEEIQSYFQKYDENGNLLLDRKEFAKLEESLTRLKTQKVSSNQPKKAFYQLFLGPRHGLSKIRGGSECSCWRRLWASAGDVCG